MSRILLTGASGLIGGALVKALAGTHEVVCIGRRQPGADVPFVRGLFTSFEDLRGLDTYDFDVLVHLAAVTGGAREREGMLVNVEGTRCLMRYLIDRGCGKFVMVSSVAAIGIHQPRCGPLSLPISDDHPCLARGAYGWSKHMMEQVTHFYARLHEEIDVINLRPATVVPDDHRRAPCAAGPIPAWTLGTITVLFLSDCVRALRLAIDAPLQPGLRTLNATAAHANVADTLPDVIRAWYPDTEYDLSWYERPGHERDSAFDIRRIEAELGFVPQLDPLDR